MVIAVDCKQCKYLVDTSVTSQTSTLLAALEPYTKAIASLTIVKFRVPLGSFFVGSKCD